MGDTPPPVADDIDASGPPPLGLSDTAMHESSTEELPELPAELLLQALEEFRPIYLQRKGKAAFVHLGDWQPEYYVGFSFIATLRLVNRTWNRILTPLVFEKIVIYCTSPVNLEKRFQPTVHHPHLITTLILGFTWDIAEPDFQEERERLELYITTSLVECINVRKLEFVNSDHLFQHIPEDRLHHIFQSLSSDSLTALVLRFNQPNGVARIISNVLCGLGKKFMRLRELEITDPSMSLEEEGELLRLPQDFPPLEDLSLNGLGLKTIQDIFGKLHSNTPSDTPPTIPSQSTSSTSLRYLTLASTPRKGWNISLLPTMLTGPANLGNHLVSLRIDCPSPYFTMTFETLEQLPIVVTQTCPSLRSFLYFVPFVDTWVHQIPLQASHLVELGFLFANKPFEVEEDGDEARDKVVHRAEPILEMLTKHRSRLNLKTLYFFWEVSYSGRRWKTGDLPLLQKACEKAGIVFVEEEN